MQNRLIPILFGISLLAAGLGRAWAEQPFGIYDNAPYSPTVTILESNATHVRLHFEMQHLPQNTTVNFATQLPGLWENMNTDQSVQGYHHYLPRFSVLLAIANTGNASVVVESWQDTTMNASAITLDENTPGQAQASVGPVSILGGVRVSPLTVKPVTYTNGATTCLVMKSATISVEFDGQTGANPVTNPRTSFSRPWQQIYQSTITNWQYIPNIYVGAESHMLMIVPDSWISSLTSYVRWKEQRGIKVTIVPKSSIASNPTADQVRQRIISEIAASYPRIDYVTLVGDESQLPVSMLFDQDLDTRFSFGPNSQYPGNYTNEGMFCALEGDDALPDVFLGRWPVASTSDVQKIAAREILHERDTFQGDSLRFERAVVAADLGDAPGGQATIRKVAHELASHGFATVDSMWSGPAQTLINYVNQGETFVNYRGSGWYNGWAGINFYVGDVDQLNNVRKLPIVTGIGCGVGMFDGPGGHCFGEEWMLLGTSQQPEGAAGFVGPCWNTHSVFNNCLDSTFYRAFLDYKILELQPAFVAGKIMTWTIMADYLDESPLLEVMNTLMRQYLVLCDPSLQVFTDTPVHLIATVPPSVPPGPVSLTIGVTNLAQVPADSAQVTAWVNDSTFSTSWIHQGESTVNVPVNATNADSVLVTITADNTLAYRATIPVAPSGPYMAHIGLTLNDVSGGNGNGLVNPGETLNWQEQLANIGTVDGLGTTATLTIANSHVSITQPSLTIGTVAVGDTLSPATPFEFTVNDSATANESLNFTVTFNMDNGPPEAWPVSVHVFAPQVVLQSVAVYDNGNGIWDRGETVGLVVTLSDSGNADLANATCTLTTTDSLITILDGQATLPGIAHGGVYALPSNSFSLQSSWLTPSDHQGFLNLAITSNMGTYTYNVQIPISVAIGQTTSTDPFHDTGTRYWIYDNSDSIYSQRPDYDWIEISALQGGQGEEIPYSIGSQTFAFPVPFSYNYYGISFDSLSISNDGWVKPGRTTQTNQTNAMMPAPDNVPGMVAPLWFNLWRIQGGSETGQIWFYYDPDTDKFIVEWHQIHDQSGQYPETFEVQLLNPATYPTPTGDAQWLFLYQQVSARATSQQGATVGIENPAQNLGATYIYHGGYAAGAAVLDSGRVIKITTEPPTIIVAASPREVALPTEIDLHQNYPNPFNPETTIEFALPHSDVVKLTVFDVLGRNVETLWDGPIDAGMHKVTWHAGLNNGTSAASGIYFYQLQTSQSVITRKMVLLR